MAIVVEYQPPTTVIEAYNQQILDTPKLLTTAYTRNTSRLRSRWIAALRVEPPPASNFYPVRWKTRKQQRAFFATNGFGRGIPTVRMHQLSRGWKGSITPFENGGEIAIYNTTPSAVFVYGSLDTPRQPMFVKIPWLDPFEVSYPFMDEAENVLIETLNTVSSPTAGV